MKPRITPVPIVAALLLAATVSSPTAGEAQVRIAPTLAWGEKADLALGGRLLVNLSRVASAEADQGLASKLDLVIPFDWFLDCSNCTYFEVTPGLILPLTIRDVGPYLGAGLNIARLSVDTDGQDESDMSVGLGLTGGVLFPIGGMTGFGEARFTAGGQEQLVITVGVQLGGREN